MAYIHNEMLIVTFNKKVTSRIRVISGASIITLWSTGVSTTASQTSGNWKCTGTRLTTSRQGNFAWGIRRIGCGRKCR